MNEACEAPTQAQSTRGTQAAIAVAVAVAALYLLAVARLAVDFPYWDDFSVLDGLSKYQAADTRAQKLRLLLSQHNEHRVTFMRAVLVAGCAAEGRVDFPTMIGIGNLGLLGLCAVLAAGAWRTIRSAAVLALIPLALLSPIQEKQMIWVTCVLSNFWVLAFAAAALLLVTARGRPGFGLACALAVIATFTSGGGLLCFGVGAAMLAMQRRWVRIGVWLAVMAAAAAVYFHHYSRPPYHPPPQISWTTVQFFPVVVGGALSDLTCRLLAPLLNALGAEAALVPTIQAGAGLILIGLALLLLVKRYHERNLFLAGFLFYLLLLCAVASVTRSGFGLQHALMSHYKVISASIAMLIVVALLDLRWNPSGRRQAAILAGGVLVSLLSWCLFYPTTQAFSKMLAEGRDRFIRTQQLSPGLLPVALREQGVDILWQCYLSGMLRLQDLDHGEGGVLSPERLARIATRQTGSAAGDRGTAGAESGRVVASLTWSGEDLRVRRSPTTAKIPQSAGVIRLAGGKLFYALPADPPGKAIP